MTVESAGRSPPQVVVPGAMWGTPTTARMPGPAPMGLLTAGHARHVGTVSTEYKLG